MPFGTFDECSWIFMIIHNTIIVWLVLLCSNNLNHRKNIELSWTLSKNNFSELFFWLNTSLVSVWYECSRFLSNWFLAIISFLPYIFPSSDKIIFRRPHGGYIWSDSLNACSISADQTPSSSLTSGDAGPAKFWKSWMKFAFFRVKSGSISRSNDRQMRSNGVENLLQLPSLVLSVRWHYYLCHLLSTRLYSFISEKTNRYESYPMSHNRSLDRIGRETRTEDEDLTRE